jgi:hypothetical protein
MTADSNRQFEVDSGAELSLDRAAGRRANRLDHAPAGADQDALLRLGFGEDHAVDPDQLGLLPIDRFDLDLDRVGKLLPSAREHLLADQLGEVDVF